MIPPEATWLRGLPLPVLMRDVDRFVDQLYKPTLELLKIPHLIADCHRYVIDLNRKPEEFDQDSVQGAVSGPGTHPKGLHWSITTLGEKLISDPMTQKVHAALVANYYDVFHNELKKLAKSFRAPQVFHLDLHSMPSQGTAMHNDPGGRRADVVVSDFHGKSARKDFVDLIIDAYKTNGFEVSYNWPYFGGGITQMYGRPEQGHHTVQIELNRALYMDESSKEKRVEFSKVQARLDQALQRIHGQIASLSVR